MHSFDCSAQLQRQPTPLLGTFTVEFLILYSFYTHTFSDDDIFDLFRQSTIAQMSMGIHAKGSSSVKKNSGQRVSEAKRVIQEPGAPSLKHFLKDADYLTQYVYILMN